MVGEAMKKTYLDSCVFLDAVLGSEKAENALAILRRVENGREKGAASTFCILEIRYHVMKKLGHEKAAEACYLVQTLSNLEVIPPSIEIMEKAADLRFKYYDKKKKQMSFVDAVHAATALVAGCDKIISGNKDFVGLEEIRCETY